MEIKTLLEKLEGELRRREAEYIQLTNEEQDTRIRTSYANGTGLRRESKKAYNKVVEIENAIRLIKEFMVEES